MSVATRYGPSTCGVFVRSEQSSRGIEGNIPNSAKLGNLPLYPPFCGTRQYCRQIDDTQATHNTPAMGRLSDETQAHRDIACLTPTDLSRCSPMCESYFHHCCMRQHKIILGSSDVPSDCAETLKRQSVGPRKSDDCAVRCKGVVKVLNHVGWNSSKDHEFAQEINPEVADPKGPQLACTVCDLHCPPCLPPGPLALVPIGAVWMMDKIEVDIVGP